MADISIHIHTMETPIIQKEIHQNLYEVDIDFDSASAAWRANKRRLGDGSFKYKDNRGYLEVLATIKTQNTRYNLRPRIAKQ
jgi:hypothetical protein